MSYSACYTSISDDSRYYPFGMIMPGRSGGEDYRHGFNGKEQDPEVSGTGNQYDYGFRIYNPRLGRFLSVDALSGFYAAWTPYMFAQNRPIKAIDLNGLQAWDGPNDVQDVMSITSYRSFVRSQIQILTSEESSLQFDCADFAFYLMAKYFEYMQVNLTIQTGSQVISSGDLRFNSFEEFYDYAKYRVVNSAYIYNYLSYEIPQEENTYGDLFAETWHTMVHTPTGNEVFPRTTLTYSSGGDYGPDNPATRVTQPFSGTFDPSDWGSRRFSFLKDLPMDLPKRLPSLPTPDHIPYRVQGGRQMPGDSGRTGSRRGGSGMGQKHLDELRNSGYILD